MNTNKYKFPIQRKSSPQIWRRVIQMLASGLLLLIALYFLIIWPWISHWGATDGEARKSLPGDDLIANSILTATKAITIQARPEEVWAWLIQLGVDRGGMYSYLWVENGLMRLHVTNVDEIRPEWQTRKVGDFIRFTPIDYALNPGPGLYIVALEPNQALIGCFGLEDKKPDCNQTATWQFILEPIGDHATRLILRDKSAGAPSAIATAGAKLAYAFQFYMERKMLISIKQRAERR